MVLMVWWWSGDSVVMGGDGVVMEWWWSGDGVVMEW